MPSKISRRQLLKLGAIASAGVLAACAPKVVEKIVEKEVTKIVKEVVKETIIVEGTPQVVEKEVTKIVKETVVVEKVAEAPEPVRGPIDLMAWSLGPMNPDVAAWKGYQDTVHEIMEDKLPGVTLTFRDMGWDEVLRQNLVTALLGGTAPDIINGESFIQPYAQIGAHLPLDDAMTEAGIMDNLIPGTYANSVTGGKMYGISVMTGVFAFESNPNVVEQAGLDPSEWPKTWSQLLERCAAITKAGKDEYYGYTLQGPVGFLVGGIMRYCVFANCAGVTMCENDCRDPYFDDPELERVLAFLREINRHTPPGLTFNPDEGQVYQQLHMGISAYQIGANWHSTWAKEHGVWDVIQYGMIPMADQGGMNASLTVGNLLVLAMSGTKYPVEAIDFIKILTMDEVTDYIYTASGGRSPSTYSGLKRALPKIEPQHKIFFEILQQADIGAMPQWPKATDRVWAAVNEMMMKLFTTEDPIPPLQAEAQAAAEKAIAEA